MQMINFHTGQGFIEKNNLAQVGSLNFHTGQGFIEKINLAQVGSLNFHTGQGYLRLYSSYIGFGSKSL